MGDMNVSSGGSCSFVGEYGNWGIMASKQQERAAAAAHVAGFKGFVAPTPASASATATVTRAEAEVAATVCVSVVESSLSSGLRFNHYHRPREHRAAVAAESARITTALGFPECASASASASVCCSNNNNNSSSSNNNNSPNSSYEVSVDALKTRIAAHPRYPRLLSAYMHCQKMGAPSEVASLLQDFTEQHGRHVAAVELGIDPELDQFMDAFSQLLEELHNQLSNPYGEAMEFLHRMEGQLRSLNLEGINSGVTSGHWEEREVDDGSGQQSSEEEFSREESDHQHQQQPEVTDVDHDHSAAHDRELKEQLLRKYIGYFSTLKQEFLKKKKKGKLPKEAREQLLDWWEAHYSWPYPSELDKAALAESTGLDQKQINNWFINQRKRHWKPSEDMQYFW